MLLTAYQAFLSQGTTDERTKAINELMFGKLCDYDVTSGGWEEFMVAVTLWFLNKNNYQDAVTKKFLEIKDTPEYKEGIKKYNFHSFVGAGYKVIVGERENPGNAFLKTILIHRRKIAENVVSRYPEFNKVIEAMNITDDALTRSDGFAESFVNESNVICGFISDSNGILDDQDFLILAASIMSFMGRFEKAEENDGRLFISRIEDIGEEIYSIPRIALYCAALWYADYNNYKQLLADYIDPLENN